MRTLSAPSAPQALNFVPLRARIAVRALPPEEIMPAVTTPFTMTQVERNGVVCLRPEGELDYATIEALRERLGQLDAHRKTVRLDLGGLTFVATAGLGVLLDASTRAHEHGAKLTFYHGRPEVERVLKLSGVDRLLTFER
jgi:anti-sigma B factor antagonist